MSGSGIQQDLGARARDPSSQLKLWLGISLGRWYVASVLVRCVGRWTRPGIMVLAENP